MLLCRQGQEGVEDRGLADVGETDQRDGLVAADGKGGEGGEEGLSRGTGGRGGWVGSKEVGVFGEVGQPPLEGFSRDEVWGLVVSPIG